MTRALSLLHEHGVFIGHEPLSSQFVRSRKYTAALSTEFLRSRGASIPAPYRPSTVAVEHCRTVAKK